MASATCLSVSTPSTRSESSSVLLLKRSIARPEFLEFLFHFGHRGRRAKNSMRDAEIPAGSSSWIK